MNGMLSIAIRAALLLASISSAASAQHVVISRSSASTLDAESGRTVSIGFTVSTSGLDSAIVVPQVSAPAGWSVVAGGQSFAIPAGGKDVWIVGFSIPTTTLAGKYKVRIVAKSGAATFRDSLTVVVAEVRSLDVSVMSRPSYVIAGEKYSARFTVRNLGNTAASIRFAPRSAMGRASLAGAMATSIAPRSAAAVTVTVATAGDLPDAAEDVLELEAIHTGDTTVRGTTSVRVAVVPKPSRLASRFHSVGADLRVRPIGFGSGVAPIEISGGGRLRESGREQIDFYCRGGVKGYSPIGERNECRVNLKEKNYELRLGDYPYAVSQLTTTGESGFGAGLDGNVSSLQVGVFGQRFRWNTLGGTEAGGYAAWKPSASSINRIAVNVLNRSRSDVSGNLASLTGQLGLGALGIVEAEAATSREDRRPGNAASIRISGGGNSTRYDAGYQNAAQNYMGPQRGITYSFANAQKEIFARIGLRASFSKYDTDRDGSNSTPTYDPDRGGYLTPSNESFTNVSGGITLFNRFNIDYSEFGREQKTPTLIEARQRSVRVSGAQQIGWFSISGDFERGVARNLLTSESGPFNRYSLSPRISAGGQSFGLYYSSDDGRSALAKESGSVAAGIDGVFHLPGRNDINFSALRVRPRFDGAVWTNQLDGRVSHLLSNGQSIGVRAHVVERRGSSRLLSHDQTAIFLEYGVPLRLPIFPVRSAGRIEGTVVDAASGKGVAGALVALAGKSALSDRKGRVFFSGVKPGDYPLTVGDEAAASGSVLAGDDKISVPQNTKTPVRFKVALTAGGEAKARVRRYVSVRIGVGGAVDSLADAGPLAEVLIELAGTRDTLYQITSADGVAEFGNVPPGSWTMSVIGGELQPFEAFEPARMDLRVQPGVAAVTEFRLVPSRRDVKILGDDEPENVETLILRTPARQK